MKDTCLAYNLWLLENSILHNAIPLTFITDIVTQ